MPKSRWFFAKNPKSQLFSMSIFKTHPNLLQTNSLCCILRTYIISRGCIKQKFSKKLFFRSKKLFRKNIFPENFEKSENFPIFKSLIFQFFEIFIFRKCSFFFLEKIWKKYFFRKNIFDRKKRFRKKLFYTISGYGVRTQYKTQRTSLQQVWVGLKNRHRKKLGFWIFREKSSTFRHL